MVRKHVLKILSLSSVICMYSTAGHAQTGFKITTNGYIVMNGSPHLVLKDCDLIQNGNLQAGAGTVKFSGSSANSSISGTGPLNFYNLTVDEAAADVILDDNIAVSNNLNMVSRHIDLNANNIDLGTTGMIMGESNTSYVTGQSGGNILRTATLNAPIAANPGNIGIEITTTGALGATQIRRGHQQQTGTMSGVGIYRYFDIVPAGNNSGLNASLNFHYLDHEVAGFNEADLAMTARDVPMGYWSLLGVNNLDMTNNLLLKNAIDTLGRFTLTSSQNNVLPIMLLSFYGSLLNGQSIIKWEVANELSISKYDVEKSADGITFSKLGTIKAKGATTGLQYDYTDKAPYKGSSYYRLRLYDHMEQANYSKVIRVDMNETYTLSVYPNPVTDKVTIDFNCTEVKDMSFQLMDVQGKIISEKHVHPAAGANKIEWNVSALPAATYYIRLNGISETPIKISKY